MEFKKLDIDQLLVIWEKIGLKNMFISDATNPPFSRQQLERCPTIITLKKKITAGKWPIGKGFYYRDLCLINQQPTSDRWFAIRNTFAFDIFNFNDFKDGDFELLISRIFKAKAIDLVNHNY